MRHLIIAVGLSLALLMTLTTVASAGGGNAYGKRIKACTGLSYGQLKKVALAGELEGHDPSVIEGLKPAWGAKKTWLHIKDACVGEDVVAGFGKGKAYGRRIKECTGFTYGQLKNAARAGELPGHDPELIEGIKPAWGAKRTWMHILPYCQPPEVPVEEP